MNIFTKFKLHLKRFGLEYFGKFYGVYRATVIDNNDPDKLGRVKLSIPQIYGEQEHNYWAWPKGMASGKNIGFLQIPNVGDGVYVCFENGDAEYPIWEHGWWAEGEMIKAAEDNYPKNSVIQTTSGHRIEMDDKDELIRITSNKGAYVEINTKGVSLVRSGKKISLGSLDGSSEPAVLGDKNADQLTAHLDHTKDVVTEMLKMMSAFVPSNPASITAITAKLTAMQIQLAATRAKIQFTKSKNVTLDD